MNRIIITHNGVTYNVSSIASQIEHYTSIYEQPGKLTFVLEKDPYDLFQVEVGDLVEFAVIENDEKKYNVFKGIIFTLGTDSTEAYKVVAYDKTRYLKNKDVLFVENMTLSQLFEKICKIHNIPYNCKCVSQFVLESKLYNNVSYYSMLHDAINQTLQGDPSAPMYFIRDNFGTLELVEHKSAIVPYVLGDGSLLTDYRYEVDIDKNTYNRIKIINNTSDERNIDSQFQDDAPSILKFGLLQQVINVNSSDIVVTNNILRNMLQLRNRPNVTTTLNAMGIVGLNAGFGFHLRLNKLRIEQQTLISSAIHRYDEDNHTMELEVSTPIPLNELPSKPETMLIIEIINGTWGDGDVRKDNITQAGYDFTSTQNKINKYYDLSEKLKNGDGLVNKVNGEYRLSDVAKTELLKNSFEPYIIETILNK